MDATFRFAGHEVIRIRPSSAALVESLHAAWRGAKEPVMHEGHPGLAAAFLHALRSLPQMRGQSACRHLRIVRRLPIVRHVS
jgi:hypothetical protein